MRKVEPVNAANGGDQAHHLVFGLENGHAQNGSVRETIANAAVGQIHVQTDLEQFEHVVVRAPMDEAVSRVMVVGGATLEGESARTFGCFDVLQRTLGGA